MPQVKKYTSKAEKQAAYRQRKTVRKEAIQIDHPPLRWLGGKWRLAEWIIERFPPHVTYVEPYAGGASVLLQKTPAEIEVLNDLNHDVVNFFDMLRRNAGEVIRAIELTPFSREVHQRAYEPSSDPLEKALRFYIRCWQSFQPGSGGTNSGWRFQKTNNRGKPVTADWNATDHLWDVAARLKLVQVENDDAISVIKRFDSPKTLFYVDPPYVVNTRSGSNTVLYAHEMDDADHRRLADVLRNVKGMVILSGYPCELYNELYSGWQTCEKSTTTNGNNQATEWLWLCQKAVDVAKLPLFAGF